MTDRLTISVAISTVGRTDQLRRCLEHLRRQVDPVDDVVVVDQSRDWGTARVCRELGSPVRWIPSRARGLSRGRNAGIAAAHGSVVAMIDDDCMAEPGWAAAIRDVFARHPAAEGVFGDIVAAVDERGAVATGGLSLGAEREHRRRILPYRVGYGGNMALERDLLLSLGPAAFDEHLGSGSENPGAEDDDLVYRMLKEGHVLVSAPSVRVTHEQWRGQEVMPRLFHGYSLGAGAYAAKHLARGDWFAGYILVCELAAAGRVALSGLRRRSLLRVRVGLARATGVLHGAIRGVRLARR